MTEEKSLEGLAESLADHPMYVEGWRHEGGVRLREDVGELEPPRLRKQMLREVIDILEIERPIFTSEDITGKEDFNDEELRLILQALREGYDG